MAENWTHKYVDTKPIEGWEPEKRIRVTAGLNHLNGNQRPYFSVTAEIGHAAGGCMHKDVLEHWPELAPVVALHLSDDRGEPMHLEDNGLYWLGFGKYSNLDLEGAARHFRVSEERAAWIREAIKSDSGYNADLYGEIIAAMKPRMQSEADEAKALLDSLAKEASHA